MTDQAPDMAAEVLGLAGVSDAPDAVGSADFAPENYIPPGCDLLSLTAVKVAQLIAKGVDPRVNRVAVRRVISGRHAELIGTFAAAGSTIAGLASYGPGTYDVHGINAIGKYVCSARHRIGSNGELTALPPLGAPTGASSLGNGMSSSNPMEAIMFRLLEQRLLAPQQDPMRDAMAEMLKMLVVTNQQNASMAQQQQQFLMSQMQIAKQASESVNGPANAMTDKLFSALLETMKSNGNGSSAKAQIRDTLELVQFGVALAAAGSRDNPDGDEKEPSWLKHVIPIVESMGPGVVATIAQAALPKEKADMVVETIKSHMQAREAEAKADVVDTDGQEVG